MTSFSHRLVVIALALIVVTSALYSAVKFTSTWAAPDAGKVSFKGRRSRRSS